MLGKHNGNTHIWYFDVLEMAWHQPLILWLYYKSHVQCYGRQLQYAIYNVRNWRCTIKSTKNVKRLGLGSAIFTECFDSPCHTIPKRRDWWCTRGNEIVYCLESREHWTLMQTLFMSASNIELVQYSVQTSLKIEFISSQYRYGTGQYCVSVSGMNKVL